MDNTDSTSSRTVLFQGNDFDLEVENELATFFMNFAETMQSSLEAGSSAMGPDPLPPDFHWRPITTTKESHEPSPSAQPKAYFRMSFDGS